MKKETGKSYLAAFVALTLALIPSAFAAADADVTSLVTTATDSFAAIKVFVISVVVFGVVLTLIKLLKRR